MNATITLDMRKKRLRIHKKTLHLLNDPQYVYICINPKEKTIAICASDGAGKDAVKVKDERNFEIYSSGLFYELERLNRDMYDDTTYRVDGIVETGYMKAEFSILDAEAVSNKPCKYEYRKGRHEYEQ